MELGFLEIHQTLHGYRDGHRLLVSSIELDRDIHREMLILSDMSGSSMHKGFEQYYTGYPLSGIGLYAFSRTWYAPEMSRPGCVWTHTLLIPISKLAVNNNVTALSHRFRRPDNVDIDIQAYSLPLTIEDLSRESNSLENLNAYPNAVDPLFVALYGSETQRPVAISTDEPLEYEDTILQIWAKQWPALRCKFAFCSGAISPRSVYGCPFDLQVIPNTQIRQHSRAIKNLHVVDREMPTAQRTDWVALLMDAFPTESSTHSLIEFLNCFAGPSRDSVSALVLLFTDIPRAQPHSIGAEDFLLRFNSHFPDAGNRKSKIVKQILGQAFTGDRKRILGISEVDMLIALSAHAGEYGFDESILNVSQRVQSLWDDDRSSALYLLQSVVEKGNSPFGKAILTSFTACMNESDLSELAKKKTRTVYVLVSLDPRLASYTSIWHELDQASSLSLLDAIQMDSLSVEATKSIQTAIVEAGKSCIGLEAWRLFGESFVCSLLCTVNRRGYLTGDMSEWVRVLSADPTTTVQWMRRHLPIHPRVLVLILQSLDPRSDTVKSVSISDWAKISAVTGTENLEEGEILEVSAFMLAIALTGSGPDARALAKSTFPTVHKALEESKLNWRTWKTLEPLLPEIPWHWFRSWDQCERLRMAMRKKNF